MKHSATVEALLPRTMPRQNRAIERRRNILDAAFGLLEDHGVAEITTSLIAERAGVPVASVYGYFPNKMAVIAELMREATAKVDNRLETLMARKPEHSVLMQAIDATIDAIVEDYRMVPAYQRLFSAVRGNAALEPVIQASDARMIKALTSSLMEMRPDLLPLRVQAVAQTVVQTFTALQEGVVTCNNPDLFAALVAEWRTLVKAYLAPFISQ